MRAGNREQRVAVGLGARDRFGGQAAGKPGLGLDHDRLAKALGHFLPDQPGNGVDIAAGRKTLQHFDHAVGIILGGRGSDECDQPGERGQSARQD